MPWIESITAKQFDRLPVDLQDVVNYERQAHNLRQADLVDLSEFRRVKACLSEAKASAEKRWGHQIRTDRDGTSRA